LLAGLPKGRGLNIAYEAVDRHANGPYRDHLAMRWLGKKGELFDFTYGTLQQLSNRFANVLQSLGVGKGDKVFVLCGRIPDLYIAALGTWKNGSIFCPLFSAFGPEPIFQRMSRGEAKVLVTTERQYALKVEKQRPNLPHLQTILLTDVYENVSEDVLSLSEQMAAVSDQFDIPPTDPEDVATIHFTSGTTGMPKGAIHVHQAVLTHAVTAKYALDLHPGDVYWCTADPGWVTGTSYGIIAPLVVGVTSIIDEADFQRGALVQHSG
jgi:acetyl-CoA synthetase